MTANKIHTQARGKEISLKPTIVLLVYILLFIILILLGLDASAQMSKDEKPLQDSLLINIK